MALNNLGLGFVFTARDLASAKMQRLERRQIRAIVDYLKPAHTHFVDVIEPGVPPTFDHWELGISELGETTDLY